VICGRYAASQNGVEINSTKLDNRHVNGHDFSVNKNDSGLVLTDYEDLKKTGFLEVASCSTFSRLTFEDVSIHYSAYNLAGLKIYLE